MVPTWGCGVSRAGDKESLHFGTVFWHSGGRSHETVGRRVSETCRKTNVLWDGDIERGSSED
jgi:hypothetical protein